ncbi:MAG: serine hydrolase domain-containing protein [Acidobacteriota bacterium]
MKSMKRGRSVLTLWVLCSVFGLVHGSSRQDGTDADPLTGKPGNHSSRKIVAGELENFLDPIFATWMGKLHIPGAVFLLVQDGETVLSKGYGLADRESGTPVDPDKTVFRVGSISKLLTATAVLQLYEQGRLDLHEDVNHYLTQFKLAGNYREPVTLAHLLTHTAGFDERGIGALARSAGQVLPLGQYLETDMPPRVMPPGEVISYSNHGMALAGYIVETVTGVPFTRYVRANILDPLGMDRTRFQLNEALAAHLAAGYGYQKGAYWRVPYYYLNVEPAGSLLTTATDMARFMIAQLQDGRLGPARILQQRTAREMHRQHFTHHPGLPGFAYGFYQCFKNNKPAILHGGTLPGFASVLFLIPEENLGFFISYNRVDHRLNDHVMRSFLDHYYPVERHAPLAAGLTGADRLVGSYRWNRFSRRTLQKVIQFNQEFRITSDGSTLTLHYPPQLTEVYGPTEWVQVEPLFFKRADGTDGEMAFGEDDRGRITHLFIAYRGFFPMACERLAWYEDTHFQIVLLGIVLAALLSPWIVWPLRLRRRHRRGGQPPGSRALRYARGLIGAVSLLNLLFLLGLVGGLLFISPWEFGFGVPVSYELLLLLPILSSLLTGVLLFFLLPAWRSPGCAMTERLHLGVVTAASLLFVALLHYWNLLGYRF